MKILRHPVVVLLILTLLVRILVWVSFPLYNHSGGDPDYYSQAAESLIASGGFEGKFITPIFPLSLAAISIVTGPIEDPSFWFFYQIFQLGLSLILVYLLYTLAGVAFGEGRLQFHAGIIFALYPPAIIQLFSRSPDLLYSVFLISGFLFFLLAFFKGRVKLAPLSGIFFGLAALTDPVGLYIPIICALGSLFFIKLTKRNILWLLIFIVMFSLTISPWVYRNVRLFGDEAPFIQKKIEKTFFTNKKDFLKTVAVLNPTTWPTLKDKAAKMILVPYKLDSLDQDTPTSYKKTLVDSARGKRWLFTGRETSIFFLKSLSGFYHLLLLISGIAGLWLARKKQKLLSLILALSICYVIFAAIGYGNRISFQFISPLNGFLFPYILILTIFSTYGLLSALDKWQKRTLRERI